MIIRRIPMNSFQKGLYDILKNQSTTVYDDVPVKAKKPYITFGSFTSKQVGSKTTDEWDVSMQLHIWSDYQGKREVNQIADDVTNVLTYWSLDLSKDKFIALSQDVDFFEAFPEDPSGYHGVITFIAKIQNLGE